MSERKTDNLPQVKPFLEAHDPAFERESLIKYGTPGGKKAIAKSIALLISNGAEKETDQNVSGSPKGSPDAATKIKALRAAVSLINKSNPNLITGKQLRDMITTIVMEGSQGISSVNSYTEPQNQLSLSRQEVTQTIKTIRDTQLVQLQKTKNNDIVPELDIKQ